jgi:hypothetical protein
MSLQPVFSGLIFDENDQPVVVAFVGDVPCYVVDDAGFRRHIPSEDVDRQVLNWMKESIEGHEDLLTEQTAKMLGQDDIFSRAMIQKQLEQIDKQFETLLHTGLPDDGKSYMGMMGFKVIINVHGEVVRVDQPGAISDEEGDE